MIEKEIICRIAEIKHTKEEINKLIEQANDHLNFLRTRFPLPTREFCCLEMNRVLEEKLTDFRKELCILRGE